MPVDDSPVPPKSPQTLRPLPTTPRRPRSNNELNTIFEKLRSLEIPVPSAGQIQTPSQRGSGTADNIARLTQKLFYKDKSRLLHIIHALVDNPSNFRYTAGGKYTWSRLQEELDDALRNCQPVMKPRMANGAGAKSQKSYGTQSLVNTYFSTSKGDWSGNKKSTKRSSSESSGSSDVGNSRPSKAPRTDCGSKETSVNTSFTSIQSTRNTSFSSVASDGSQDEEVAKLETDMLALVTCAEAATITKGTSILSRPLDRRALSPTSNLPQHFLLKNLPQESMCSYMLPFPLRDLEFSVRWLIYSAVLKSNISLDCLLEGLPRSDRCSKAGESEDIASVVGAWLNECVPDHLENGKDTFFKADLRPTIQSLEDVRTSNVPSSLFKLVPRQCGTKLNRLERQFGPKRFMIVTLTLPDSNLFDRPKGAPEVLMQGPIQNFLCKEQKILGTTFELFHLERRDIRQYSLRYFATCGPGIKSIAIKELFDWAVPISMNQSLLFHKAFSRLDLVLSRTTPCLAFEPHQIRLRTADTDIYADGTPEATSFDDVGLDFDNAHDPSVIMNDGCSRISPAAALLLCKRLDIGVMRPVSFQGRINGSKGIWTIAGPYDSSDRSIWIEINSTQMKVEPRRTDLVADTAEAGRWTIEVVAHSCMPRSSNLHIDFLPILHERGVPAKLLKNLVVNSLCALMIDLKDAVKSPLLLRRWLSKTHGEKEARHREEQIRESAGLPESDLEKVIQLLDAGFDPTKCRALADFTGIVFKHWLYDMIEKLKIPLTRSTMVFGIADPTTTTLKPGELFLQFSRPFGDPEVMEPIMHLEGDVLVARHPAMRNSDIQKLKAVYKPELAHLRDIVVVSSKGCIPLASKLQGGDYDGDTFWICFEHGLVEPFRNAPAPRHPPGPGFFGITQDTMTLGEVLDAADGDFKAAIRKQVDFILKDDKLGRITKAHGRLAYAIGNIADPRVVKLADAHDVIIDGQKNGYSWEEDRLQDLHKQSRHGLRVPDKPLHETARESFLENLENVEDRQLGTEFMTQSTENKSLLDDIVICGIIPKAHQFLYELQTDLKTSLIGKRRPDLEEADAHLLGPCEDMRVRAKDDEMVAMVMQRLEMDINAICRRWGQLWDKKISHHQSEGNHVGHRVKEAGRSKRKSERTSDYVIILKECYERFKALQPNFTNHVHPQSRSAGPQDGLVAHKANSSVDFARNWTALRRELTQEHTGGAPTRWELICASTLYRARLDLRDADDGGRGGTARRMSSGNGSRSRNSRTKLAFLLAGDVLCFIKAFSTPNSRSITLSNYGMYKVRKQAKQ